MKTKTVYICEGCGRESTSMKEIQECEAEGIFDGTAYPKGLMFPYYHHGFVGIFAFRKQAQPAHSHNYGDHIGNSDSYWACRTEKFQVGDSLGEATCGGDLLRSDKESIQKWISSHSLTQKHLESREFKRMVKYLKSQDIIPKYYYKGKLCEVK